MKYFYLVFLVISFTYCNQKKQPTVPDKLLIDVGFYPSFHLPVELKIFKLGNSGYLTCRVLDYDSAQKVISFDSIFLAKKDFDTFFSLLDPVSLLKIPYDTSDIGMDGITVNTVISVDDKTNKFISWSPSRVEKVIHYKFLDAVFDLANKKLLNQENYIEDVQNYFSYGLGIKIKSNNPTIIKMYGAYSIDDATGLQLFFDSLPRDKPIIMDMSNFDGMGTLLYNYFGVCDGSHNKMIWVTPGKLKEYFTDVGIDTNKMVSSIEIAKEIIEK